MTPLDALSPDQRAVLQLVLKQGKRYEDLAALLRSEPGSIRTRAIAALDALAPAVADLSVGRRGELADWLLGQQDPAESEQTIAYLRGSESGRQWVLALEQQLQDAGLEPAPARAAAAAEAEAATAPEERAEPEVEPAQAPSDTEPEPQPDPDPQPESHPEPETPLADRTGADGVTVEVDRAPRQAVEAPVEAAAAALAHDDGDDGDDRDRRRLPGFAAGATRQQPTSRLGGALLLAGIAIVLAVALIWILSSGDDNGNGAKPTPAAQTQTQSTTKTTAQQPTITGQVNLRGAGKALGVANVLAQADQRALAIQAQNLKPNTKRDAYAVWLTDGPGGKATRLGFAPAVGKNGRLEGATGLPADAKRYQRLVISRETQADPSLPGTEVLSGRITVR